MKITKDLRFSFDGRQDIIEELNKGRDADSLVGFECSRCNRLHVVNFTRLLTPFSDRDRILVDESVELTVEHSDSYVLRRRFCPSDGVLMKPIRTKANEGILAAPGNASLFLDP